MAAGSTLSSQSQRAQMFGTILQHIIIKELHRIHYASCVNHGMTLAKRVRKDGASWVEAATIFCSHSLGALSSYQREQKPILLNFRHSYKQGYPPGKTQYSFYWHTLFVAQSGRIFVKHTPWLLISPYLKTKY